MNDRFMYQPIATRHLFFWMIAFGIAMILIGLGEPKPAWLTYFVRSTWVINTWVIYMGKFPRPKNIMVGIILILLGPVTLFTIISLIVHSLMIRARPAEQA